MSYDMPIITLNSDEQLNLSFDYLANDAKEFSYTFIKCDANWKKSENNIIKSPYKKQPIKTKKG